MRPRHAIATGVTTVALATAALLGAGTATGADARAATGAVSLRAAPCGGAAAADFPVDTRIHGGPAAYASGGGPRTWSIDLANTTAAACRGIHPVLVLVDRARALEPAQVRLEFYDPAGRAWHPVRFEETDAQENVGVFDDGFPGFTIPGGGTVTVRVRLAFAPGAAAERVVANAAVVQRVGDDGEWVGESNDYAFAVLEGGDGGEDGGGGGDDGAGGEFGGGELARTGASGPLRGLGAVSGALIAGGGALVLGSRRFRGVRG
ncbi:hypothetical protein [Streptomyces sp. NPDC050504]|uniref:hypothetical protein n=1 Tax=Streptomyces sp. NPDC050504 TaxID=3365618 RepID=UPI00379CAA6C